MNFRKSVVLLVAGGVLSTAVAVVPAHAATTASSATAASASSPSATLAKPAVVSTTKSATSAKKYWKTKYCYGRTVKVEDGDTIDVKLTKGCFGWKKGKVVVVRNAGIQATEVKKGRVKADCWGNQAHSAMRALFPKKSKVRLGAYTRTKSDVKTASGQTRYVMYAYAYKSKRWVDAQAKLVAAGLAFTKGEHIEQAHNVAYGTLTQKAIFERKGMWGNASKCGTYVPAAKLQAWTGWKTNGQDSKALANTEWFKVRNVGTVPVPLYKWKVRDGSKSFGGGKRAAFVINQRVTLQPGQTMTIYPGKGTNDPANLRWYNNHPRLPFYPNAHAKLPSDKDAGRKKSSSDYAYATMLLDPAGNFRAQSVYPCLYRCAKPTLALSSIVARGDETAVLTNTGQTVADLTGVVVQVAPARHEFWAGQMLAPGDRIVLHFNRSGTTTTKDVYFGDAPGRLTDAGGRIWLRTAHAATIHLPRWGDGGNYIF